MNNECRIKIEALYDSLPQDKKDEITKEEYIKKIEYERKLIDKCTDS